MKIKIKKNGKVIREIDDVLDVIHIHRRKNGGEIKYVDKNGKEPVIRISDSEYADICYS